MKTAAKIVLAAGEWMRFYYKGNMGRKTAHSADKHRTNSLKSNHLKPFGVILLPFACQCA